MKYTIIPETAFKELQLDAGVLLKNFNPASAGVPNDADIICATTGGISVSCIPSYSDMGEDVDNCPGNTLEFKKLNGWDCKMGFNSLGTSTELIKMSLGAADVEGNKVTPRRDLKISDFQSSLWWVGDRADGGCVAVELKNALSTGGFSMQTTKNGKGQITVELTGHVSINAQETVPMVFYSIDPTP